jgi:hypothetical protein
MRFEPRPGCLALLWLPSPSRRAWGSERTSGPGCGSGDRLRGARAERGRDPGELVWRAGRIPGKSKETWTSGRAAGRQPGEIRGHRDRQQIPGCLAGGKEMPLLGREM